MPRVTFTQNLQRHVALASARVEGRTVREVLQTVFTAHPTARGYVLDEAGALRKHVTVFIAGAPVTDRQQLSDLVPEDAELYVFQALSGGMDAEGRRRDRAGCPRLSTRSRGT
jgi:hypothetical protein